MEQSTGASNPRIIIAEDERIISTDIHYFLESHGYLIVASVESGEELIRKARELKPDLALVDIMLAGSLDGIEAATRLHDELSVPVIFITAHSDNATIQRAKSSKPYGYIIKPVNHNELYSTIEMARARRELEIQLEESRRELRYSEDKFSKAFMHSPVAMLLTNLASGIMVDANNKLMELTGYLKSEIIGQSTLGLKLWSDPSERPPFIERLQKDGQVENLEVKLRDKSGHLHVVSLNSSLISIGEQPHIVTQMQDITQRKNMEEELIKSTKFEAVAILAGGIAHDFNNLLTVISGNIALIRMAISGNEEVNESLEEMDKASNMARDLSYQLLNFARISKPAIDITPVDDFIHEDVKFADTHPGIHVSVDAVTDIWQVRADATLMRRVMYHLLANAIEAMPDGGTIRVDASNVRLDGQSAVALAEGNYVKLRVIDSGVGIPQENIKKIFDPYFSTKTTYTEKGMGMGLSLAYSIVKRHRGLIQIESRVGEGTTVIIYLPATT
jgi:two-component system, cell cycle sensor histidine kinase and response regulator CckA